MRRYRSVVELEQEIGPLRQDDRMLAYRYLDCRWSLRAAAQEIGRSAEVGRRRLIALGVQPRPPGGVVGQQRMPRMERRRTVFLYVRMQMSAAEIATLLGVSKQTVLERLRRCGVTLRPRGGRHRRPPRLEAQVRRLMTEAACAPSASE